MAESIPTIIVDNGSFNTYSGLGGQDEPVITPCIIGRPRFRQRLDHKLARDTYVGNSCSEFRAVLSIKRPMENGIIINYDNMEYIWHNIFYNIHKIAPEEHTIIMTNHPMNPKAQKEKITQILFETFNVPALYIHFPEVLSAWAYSRITALSIDVGFGSTSCVPIIDGQIFQPGVRRQFFAGEKVTNYFSEKIMENCGISLGNSSDELIASEILNSTCSVAKNFGEQFLKSKSRDYKGILYELPDRQKIELKSEIFEAPEILFCPALAGSEEPSLTQMIISSIKELPIDSREILLKNIIINGGFSLMPGFVERLTDEVKSLLCETSVGKDNYENISKKVVIHSRKFGNVAPWLGAAVMCAMPGFDNEWMSKSKFEENGFSVSPTIPSPPDQNAYSYGSYYSNYSSYTY